MTAQQDISDLQDRISAAVRDQDAAGLVDEFTADAVICPPDGLTITGRAAMLAYVSESFTKGLVSYRSESTEMRSSGDLAVDSGISIFVVKDEQGALSEHRNNYMITLERRAGGRWLIKRDVWVAAAPA